MMKTRSTYMLILFTGLCIQLAAQLNPEIKHELAKELNSRETEILNTAERFFLSGDYTHARLLFNELKRKHGEHIFLKYILGICEVQDSCFFHPDLEKPLSLVYDESFVKREVENLLFADEYIHPHPTDTTHILAGSLSSSGFSDEEFIQKFGHIITQSLAFRVQLGAYRNIENFDHSRIAGLPMVLRDTQLDGITRFTIGEYKTLKEAGVLCKKARNNGIHDAFIYAVYKGKTIYFSELIKSKILTQ